MSDLQWTPGKGSTPQPIGCDRNELILALTKASQPWEKLDIIDATLKKCGLDPFFEVLDIPNSGILGEDIPESARRGHENSLIRALAIQAFGRIPNLVKKSDIAALNNDVSQNLLAVLKEEARHGETTLIRWSATIAIRSIWYDEEWQKQGKYYSVNAGIDAPRLEQRIIEDQVKPLSSNRPIQRYNYTGSVFSTEYQDYLDFWAYGPTWELFKLPSYSEDYQFLVQQVLNLLSGRGVKYGLKAENNYIVIEKSLKLAERIFDQFNFSQILTEISKFLQHSQKPVRDVAVEMLTPYKQKLDNKSFSILEALSFNFILQKPELKHLTILELEREILSSKEYKEKIKAIFSTALSACDANATDVRNLFSSQLNAYQNSLNQQINSFENQVNSVVNYQELIRQNRRLISTAISNIKTVNSSIVYNNLLTSSSAKLIEISEPSTYDECLLLDKELIEFKDLIKREVGKVTSNLDKQRSELTSSANNLEKTGINSLYITVISFIIAVLAELVTYIVLFIIMAYLVLMGLAGASGGGGS